MNRPRCKDLFLSMTPIVLCTVVFLPPPAHGDSPLSDLLAVRAEALERVQFAVEVRDLSARAGWPDFAAFEFVRDGDSYYFRADYERSAADETMPLERVVRRTPGEICVWHPALARAWRHASVEGLDGLLPRPAACEYFLFVPPVADLPATFEPTAMLAAGAAVVDDHGSGLIRIVDLDAPVAREVWIDPTRGAMSSRIRAGQREYRVVESAEIDGIWMPTRILGADSAYWAALDAGSAPAIAPFAGIEIAVATGEVTGNPIAVGAAAAAYAPLIVDAALPAGTEFFDGTTGSFSVVASNDPDALAAESVVAMIGTERPCGVCSVQGLFRSPGFAVACGIGLVGGCVVASRRTRPGI